MLFACFFEPIAIQSRYFCCVFCYVFSIEKVHEHETAVANMNRDFGKKKIGVKKRVFGCSR